LQITKYENLYFEKNLPKSNFDVVLVGRLFVKSRDFSLKIKDFEKNAGMEMYLHHFSELCREDFLCQLCTLCYTIL